MKRKYLNCFVMMLLLALVTACSQAPKQGQSVATDSNTVAVTQDKNDILTGAMSVIIDEATLPLMKQQVEVFQSSYTGAKIQLLSLPEREAINALIEDKASLAILARPLTEAENASFKQRNINPRQFGVYYDGVVFVNNISSADTSINIQTLTSILKGESVGHTLLLDNVNSSMVRKVKEWTKVEQISAKAVKDMKQSESVLKAVSNDPNSIGLLSYGQYLEYRRQFGDENKIRILSLQSVEGPGKGQYFKPSQTTFATDEYPLKTEFLVLNYQPNMGLGIGFSAFLTGDRGQRVVLKAGLLPATMPGREIIIRDNIN